MAKAFSSLLGLTWVFYLGGSAQVDDVYFRTAVTGKVKVAHYDPNDSKFYAQRIDWGCREG